MRITDDMVEVAAKAMWEMRDCRSGGSLTWEEVLEHREDCPNTYYTAETAREEARAGLIAALSSSEAPPPPVPHLVGIEEGIERAARYIEKQRDDYVQEFGNYDPSTGATEFSTAGEEYLSTLEELIEEIRALHEQAPAPVSREVGDG